MVKDVVFSPDESKIVSGGHEKMLRVWDIEEEEKPINILNKQNNPIKHIVWNRLYDNIIISASGEDNILHSWDIRTNEIVDKFTIGNVKDEPITSMKITKDARIIVLTTKSHVTFLNAKK